MGTIFLAGVYGVGKSTIGRKLNSLTSIPFYSAGDLISEINGETYGANKVVKDKNNNQKILSKAVQKKLNSDSRILLAGHFCIFDKECNIDILPISVFKQLTIEKIILLEAENTTIFNHIANRDSKEYSIDCLNSIIIKEKECAINTAKQLNVPLYIHHMKFNNSDVSNLMELIN